MKNPLKPCHHPCCPDSGPCRKHRKREAIKQRSPIRKQSDKMRQALLEYAKLRKAFLKAHPVCEIPVKGCDKAATDVHHMAGRGKQLLNTATWKAACRSCHDWVTEHSREAIEMGYSQSRLTKRA